MAVRSPLMDNLARVRERMAAAAQRARRDVAAVRLVAVSKSATDSQVLDAVELGLRDLGESRVNDLQRRAAEIGGVLARRHAALQPAVRWHMIGHLQRNKVKPLLPIAEMIHSVDTLRLAETIDIFGRRFGRRMPVLLEVNCSCEPQKYGVAVGAVECLIEQLATLENLELHGLMTMAPRVDHPEDARASFCRLREIFDDIVSRRLAGPQFRELSMGMTQDYAVAIEEGATMVRIGSALFGEA